MNVLIIDKERLGEISLHTIRVLDFLFVDMGNGLYEIKKNRLNNVTGQVTIEACRELVRLSRT